MERDITEPSEPPRAFDEAWRHDRGYLLGMATRMLGDRNEAEDVVQDAFARLARAEQHQIDDVRGWLAVVVRRLCLDRIGSAHTRRESVAGALIPDAYRNVASDDADPADRVTLDDQVQLALAIV